MNLFLLKSAGIIALFLIIYKIFLEHDTYFKSIRHYFILGIVASIVVPLISITKYIEAPQTQQIIYSQNFQNFVRSNEVTPFNWSAFLFYTYIIGVALSGLYFIFQIISLFKILNTKSVKKYNNYKIVETTKEVSPFSFFKYIVYNPTQFDAKEIKQLLKHEETHVLQRHSIDMLLAHTLTCVQWFNPFAWFYKKAITQNLEYIADKEAKFTIAPKNYSYLLLKTTAPNYKMVLANNFYNSLLKKRIMMLHKNHSPRLKQFKLALILPLLVGFVLAFNTKVVAQQKQDSKPKIENIDIDTFAMQFEKNADNSYLDRIKSSFKKKFGFDIKIKKLKRNDKNEITGIKITAKKGKTNVQYATSSNNPIQPIKIEYNGKSDKISIATGTDEHNKNRNFFSYEIKNFTGDPQELIKLQNNLVDDKDKNNIIFINDSDTIHKLKGNNYIVFSDDIKDKDHNTFMTKSKNKVVKVVFIDDDGTKTNIIEVKTDKKPQKLHKKHIIIKNNSKSTWKDKDGNITKTVEVKTDKNGNIIKTIKVTNDGNIIRVDGKKGHKFKIGKDAEVVLVKDFKNITKDNNDTIIKVKSNQKAKKDTPIYFLNGKVITSDKFDNIDTNTIKSVSVIKGKAADMYGEKGKNGVILITTKKRGQNKPKKSKSIIVRTENNNDIDDDIHKVIDIDASNNKNAFVFSSSDGGTPLFVVDGKIKKSENMEKLEPNSIKSITVLKGAKAIKKYGRKGKNGVIEITTKKKVKK